MLNDTIRHGHLNFGLVNVMQIDVEQFRVESQQSMRNVLNRLSYETHDPCWESVDDRYHSCQLYRILGSANGPAATEGSA